MICPRCSIGTISEQTHECTLCGFAPVGGVLTETTFLADLDPAVRDEVERHFHPRAVVQHTVRSLVCLAEDRATERPVLLKILPLSPDEGGALVEALHRDLTLATDLEHPHIVPVQRFGVSRAACWYSTAYVPSSTLADGIRRAGTLDVSAAVRLVQQVGGALDYAHRRGALHGLLSPSTILLDADGWARITDCGTARAWGVAPPLRAGRVAESALPYLAPEWFAANQLVAASADQYALGAVTYECLTGSPPFRGATFDDFYRAHREMPAPLATAVRPEIASSVARAIQRALTKRPAGRFPNVLDFAAAISDTGKGALQPPAPVSARVSPQSVLLAEPTPPPPPAPRKGRKAIAISAAVVAALIAGLALLLFWPSAAPSDATWTSAADSAADTGWATLAPEPPRKQVPGETTAVRGYYPADQRPLSPTPEVRLDPAHLFISSTPWADLSIDGRPAGTTPTINRLVPPGRHRLRFTRDGFEPREAIIRAAPGDTIRLTDVTLTAVAR